MAANRDGTPLIDLAAIAISPALIMGMVGSLVWFIVDVLYGGAYPDRLLWCLSFFVFGAVLIARLTIEQGYAYAMGYGAALGGVTFLAMMAYVSYPNRFLEAIGWAISLGLMALTWWLADRLTWDCTHFDDERKASGRGILAAVGLDSVTGKADPKDDDEEDPEEAAKPRKKDPRGLLGWVERINRYREARRKKPHTPGTWVLYFGLAALPLFALGQSLIAASDTARRRTTLMEVALFVGCGLGLLVTTSLMGLRRYLQQRNAPVPVAMTAGWLGSGAALIVFFVGAAMLLPRPHSETAWFGMTQAGQSSTGERSASRFSAKRDGSTGKGDGAKGSQGEQGKKGQSSEQKGKSGSGGQQKSEGSGNQKGEKGQSSQQQGQQKSEGENGQSDQKSPGEKSQDGQKSQSGQEKKGDSGQKSSAEKSQSEENSSEKGQSQSQSSSSATQRMSEMFSAIGTFFKWILWFILAAAVVAAAVFFVLKGLAPFTNWAKNLLNWLKSLFAGWERPTAKAEAAEEEPAGPSRPPPFSAFSNPFADGTAKRRQTGELVAYTFTALDSWAWDRDHGRQPGETPAEWAGRLTEAFAELGSDAEKLADLVARANYSLSPLPAEARKVLKDVWDRLERVESRPVASGRLD